MPLVSILVPIFNVERYLRQCLESVLHQTFADIEVIAIDDGSTDSCPAILAEFAARDARLRVITKANTGYGHSMNRGLEAATGRYLAIVESDDFVAPEMIADLVAIAEEHDAQIVKAAWYNYSTAADHASIDGVFPEEECGIRTSMCERPELIEWSTPIWNCLYRRDFLEELPIRFLETPGASYQDTSFGFKTLALAQRLILCPKAYLYYRTDNEASSVKSKGKAFMVSTEYAEMTRFLNEHPKHKAALNSAKLIRQYRLFIWNLLRTSPELHRDFITVFADTFHAFDEAGELDDTFYRTINSNSFSKLAGPRLNRLLMRLLTRHPRLFLLLYRLAWRFAKNKPQLG